MSYLSGDKEKKTDSVIGQVTCNSSEFGERGSFGPMVGQRLAFLFQAFGELRVLPEYLLFSQPSSHGQR
jgi:hypothetical protein